MIVGFPGETEEDVAELERFLTEAGLDAIGVFGYSDEDGTEAASFDGKVDPAEVAERVRPDLTASPRSSPRSAPRTGWARSCRVLVEAVDEQARSAEGRAEHQAPEVDGSVALTASGGLRPGVVRPGARDRLRRGRPAGRPGRGALVSDR